MTMQCAGGVEGQETNAPGRVPRCLRMPLPRSASDRKIEETRSTEKSRHCPSSRGSSALLPSGTRQERTGFFMSYRFSIAFRC